MTRGVERLRIISINLRDRDGLEARLDSVRCPVLWMQGTADRVYSVSYAEEEIKLFVDGRDAELRVVDGGQHFLSATHPDEVNTGDGRVHQALDVVIPRALAGPSTAGGRRTPPPW